MTVVSDQAGTHAHLAAIEELLALTTAEPAALHRSLDSKSPDINGPTSWAIQRLKLMKNHLAAYRQPGDGSLTRRRA